MLYLIVIEIPWIILRIGHLIFLYFLRASTSLI